MRRFQVMAALQAARALALGLSLDEAKSWRLNRATFYAYAAAKRRFRRCRSGTGIPAAERTPAPAHKAPHNAIYELGGEQAYPADGAGAVLRFQMGDETQTPEDLDRELVRGIPAWDEARAEARAIIEAADLAHLERRHYFFKRVYKPRRDELVGRRSSRLRSRRPPVLIRAAASHPRTRRTATVPAPFLSSTGRGERPVRHDMRSSLASSRTGRRSE